MLSEKFACERRAASHVREENYEQWSSLFRTLDVHLLYAGMHEPCLFCAAMDELKNWCDSAI